jgi:uncharacterized membrane protein
MFEFLFKYPAAAFAKGHLVFLASWPVWALLLLVLAGATALAYPFLRSATRLPLGRRAILWSLQAGFLALLLLMLWQPALSISTLRPQQNIVEVIVDDSRSMATADAGQTRRDAAAKLLDSGLLDRLKQRFQVRLYRASAGIERIPGTKQLTASGTSTHLGDALRQVSDEAASMPVGAVVLLSDGADNAGGLDLATMDRIRHLKVPVHTIGFGRERLEHDVEITAVDVPARALAGSRVNAQVSLRQFGYAGRSARLKAMAGSTIVAAREITFKDDGVAQTESLVVDAGDPGARALRFQIDPLGGEENDRNNAVNRVITVDGRRPRILYIEGEPRWEYKFLRRAAEEDSKRLDLVSMVRTTQNKIYRQGIANASELEDGFPAKVEELFGFQGLIIGGIEAGYFTPEQLDLIRQFADRRGGGVLFLAGRFGLEDGGWTGSSVAEMLPVRLPERKDAFRREPANVELTGAGKDSLICRLDDDPVKNAERWRKLPYLANYQNPGTPRAGAVVLADMLPASGGRLPLLITQNYGRGRTAVFASAGSWRWQMLQPLGDKSHELFWQQLLRWLVAGTSDHVSLATDKSVYTDENRVRLTATVWDPSYAHASDAIVQAHLMGPGGLSQTVDLKLDPAAPGVYKADIDAGPEGSYIVEATGTRNGQEIGRDLVSFQRQDGVAESFHIEQNRDLLEKLSAQTGGRYYTPAEAARLGEEINYSEAGISTRETWQLWNMPLLFLLALVMRSSEWLLRRKWGVV